MRRASERLISDVWANMKRLIAIALCALALAACSEWSLDTYWKSAEYRLIAIDVRAQMCLIFEDDGVTLVGPTIFAVGSDTKHVVVKQHPAIDQWAGKIDRSITNYFVVERRTGTFADRKAGVRGPLKKEEFDHLAASLSLPPFTKTFDDLQ